MAGTTASGWAGSGTTADPYRLVFDGVDDEVDVIGLSTGTSWTYEVWYIQPAASPGEHALMGGGVSATTYENPPGIQLGVNYGRVHVVMVTAGWADNVDSGYGPTACDGLPHHLLATCDASLVRLYLDNVLVGTPFAPSAAPGMSMVQIGQGLQQGWFPGSIAVARICPFALNAAQVAQNFAAGPQASAGVWGDGVTPGAVLELVAAYGNAFVGG